MAAGALALATDVLSTYVATPLIENTGGLLTIAASAALYYLTGSAPATVALTALTTLPNSAAASDIANFFGDSVGSSSPLIYTEFKKPRIASTDKIRLTSRISEFKASAAIAKTSILLELNNIPTPFPSEFPVPTLPFDANERNIFSSLSNRPRENREAIEQLIHVITQRIVAQEIIRAAFLYRIRPHELSPEHRAFYEVFKNIVAHPHQSTFSYVVHGRHPEHGEIWTTLENLTFPVATLQTNRASHSKLLLRRIIHSNPKATFDAHTGVSHVSIMLQECGFLELLPFNHPANPGHNIPLWNNFILIEDPQHSPQFNRLLNDYNKLTPSPKHSSMESFIKDLSNWDSVYLHLRKNKAIDDAIITLYQRKKAQFALTQAIEAEIDFSTESPRALQAHCFLLMKSIIYPRQRYFSYVVNGMHATGEFWLPIDLYRPINTYEADTPQAIQELVASLEGTEKLTTEVKSHLRQCTKLLCMPLEYIEKETLHEEAHLFIAEQDPTNDAEFVKSLRRYSNHLTALREQRHAAAHIDEQPTPSDASFWDSWLPWLCAIPVSLVSGVLLYHYRHPKNPILRTNVNAIATQSRAVKISARSHTVSRSKLDEAHEPAADAVDSQSMRRPSGEVQRSIMKIEKRYQSPIAQSADPNPQQAHSLPAKTLLQEFQELQAAKQVGEAEAIELLLKEDTLQETLKNTSQYFQERQQLAQALVGFFANSLNDEKDPRFQELSELISTLSLASQIRTELLKILQDPQNILSQIALLLFSLKAQHTDTESFHNDLRSILTPAQGHPLNVRIQTLEWLSNDQNSEGIYKELILTNLTDLLTKIDQLPNRIDSKDLKRRTATLLAPLFKKALANLLETIVSAAANNPVHKTSYQAYLKPLRTLMYHAKSDLNSLRIQLLALQSLSNNMSENRNIKALDETQAILKELNAITASYKPILEQASENKAGHPAQAPQPSTQRKSKQAKKPKISNRPAAPRSSSNKGHTPSTDSADSKSTTTESTFGAAAGSAPTSAAAGNAPTSTITVIAESRAALHKLSCIVQCASDLSKKTDTQAMNAVLNQYGPGVLQETKRYLPTTTKFPSPKLLYTPYYLYFLQQTLRQWLNSTSQSKNDLHAPLLNLIRIVNTTLPVIIANTKESKKKEAYQQLAQIEGILSVYHALLPPEAPLVHTIKAQAIDRTDAYTTTDEQGRIAGLLQVLYPNARVTLEETLITGYSSDIVLHLPDGKVHIFESDGRHHQTDPGQIDTDTVRDTAHATAGLLVTRLKNKEFFDLAPAKQKELLQAIVTAGNQPLPEATIQAQYHNAAYYRAQPGFAEEKGTEAPVTANGEVLPFREMLTGITVTLTIQDPKQPDAADTFSTTQHSYGELQAKLMEHRIVQKTSAEHDSLVWSDFMQNNPNCIAKLTIADPAAIGTEAGQNDFISAIRSQISKDVFSRIQFNTGGDHTRTVENLEAFCHPAGWPL